MSLDAAANSIRYPDYSTAFPLLVNQTMGIGVDAKVGVRRPYNLYISGVFDGATVVALQAFQYGQDPSQVTPFTELLDESNTPIVYTLPQIQYFRQLDTGFILQLAITNEGPGTSISAYLA